ncbi:hypothetical protein GCM10023219_29780 [Stakelama sediminis]|uniref:Peptidyl-prolyl cis-trans isomerase n=1 Tax=Stakelama sediminis TaxID=463200 RepID=A0A840Z3T6_9SPHN|nr:FKBP-type peptidyl-prolyl cis-trans isomerase [Stakelama sediminis]MBB5720292.1 FKBP-type peptidyl-prolyl cis-trans isomerase FkpA [Stakelama sediminis]
MSVTAVPLQPVKRGYIAWIWVGVVAAIAIAAALAWHSGVKSTASGLKYQVIHKGTGPHPTDDDVALVTYTGHLPDGTVFDKSEQPAPLPVSAVVPGFQEGLKLMQKDGDYRLWIPAKLGYGDHPPQGSEIPADSPLIFDVHMIDFISEAQFRQMMQMRMMQMQQGAGGGAGVPGTSPSGQ